MFVSACFMGDIMLPLLTRRTNQWLGTGFILHFALTYVDLSYAISFLSEGGDIE